MIDRRDDRPDEALGRSARSAGDRVYAALMWLYPSEFRARFGRDMVDFFRDRRRAARRSGGVPGVVAAWCRGVIDVLTGAALERAHAVGRAIARATTNWRALTDAS